MLIRSKVVIRDVVLGAFVATLLTALSPSLNTPPQGLALAGLFNLHASHKPHCE